jgi:flagellar assembly protein FliH
MKLLSRIFKSNYVKVGSPKPIKANTPIVPKKEEHRTMEVHQAQSLEEKANSIIEDAKEMYLRIIEEANFEAQKIIEQANQNKEALMGQAAQQGYQEGYDSGYSHGLNQAAEYIQQAAELKSHLDARSRQMYKEAEKEIMQMVTDIAEKVVGEELVQNPSAILSIIKQAIAKCAFKDRLVIRVSEQDYEYVLGNKEWIAMLAEGINDLEIACDKALDKGSCIVETPSGEVNAGVRVQMNEVKKAFEYLMRNE